MFIIATELENISVLNVELTCFIFHRTERNDAPVLLISLAAEGHKPLGPVLRSSVGELPA